MKSNHVDSRSWSAAMADSLQSQHASINNLVKTPHGPNIIPVLSPIRRVKMCTDKSAVGSFLRQFTKKTVLSHCIQPCWLSSPGEKVPLFFFPLYLDICRLFLYTFCTPFFLYRLNPLQNCTLQPDTSGQSGVAQTLMDHIGLIPILHLRLSQLFFFLSKSSSAEVRQGLNDSWKESQEQQD